MRFVIQASHALVNARGAAAAKLDYSFISVELASILGTAKEKTECSPNGYYFIPVEDKVRGNLGPLIASHKCCIGRLNIPE
jgi:hypothetical protein